MTKTNKLQIDDLKNKHILVICESPNKVSHLREFIQKAGYKHVVVKASVGHIMELRSNGGFANTGIFPEENFRMDIGIDPEKAKVADEIKALAKNSDVIFMMTDGDREGEVISSTVMNLCKLPKTKCFRAITHEITPKAVVAAIENPVPFDENMVAAGLARSCIDKMIGFGLSPIAKRYVGAKSVGRCQSVGLKLVVDRELEIQSFVPETFYDIYVHFEKNNVPFKAKYIGTDNTPIDHLKTQAEVDSIKKLCAKDNYLVKGIERKEKKDAPKPPFCTATFQQEAANKLGLKVKDAMSCAQKLFEQGLCNYLRTDDTTIADEALPALESYINATFGKGTFTKPRVGKKDEAAQAGHECFRVTDPNTTPELAEKKLNNPLLAKVYRLVWQRTIAACMPDATISETIYNIYNNDQKFTMSSKEIIKPGYKTVYTYADDKDNDGIIKEIFIENEKLQNTELEDVKKQTKPKPRFTEASLIKELQKREIGRPSTYATIVETILSPTRNYAKLDDKAIVPTDIGMALARYCDKTFSKLVNLDYTREMEKDLDLVANGKMNSIECLTTFYDCLVESIKKVCPEEAEPRICPECGKPLKIRMGKYGKFLGCTGYPNCKHVEKLK